MESMQLSPAAVRILGALIEKQALTPDSYPLTLNALQTACNQLTSREPVMQLDESELSRTLDELLQDKLINVRLPAGSRVSKYEHRLNYAWNVDGAKLAALAMLMLRGPQTAAEIRTRAGRVYNFSGAEEVETALQALADKFPPLAHKMAKQAGAREARWCHLLHPQDENDLATGTTQQDNPALQQRVEALEQTVAELLQRIELLEQTR